MLKFRKCTAFIWLAEKFHGKDLVATGIQTPTDFGTGRLFVLDYEIMDRDVPVGQHVPID